MPRGNSVPLKPQEIAAVQVAYFTGVEPGNCSGKVQTPLPIHRPVLVHSYYCEKRGRKIVGVRENSGGKERAHEVPVAAHAKANFCLAAT